MNFNRREAIRLGVGAGIATVFGKWIPKKWYIWTATPTEPLILKYRQAGMTTLCSRMTWERLVKDFHIQIYNRSPLICGLLENAIDEPIEEECRANFMRS